MKWCEMKRKTIDTHRYLEADDTDTVHELLHLDWIIGTRSHQWPSDLVQWNFHYHWALLI